MLHTLDLVGLAQNGKPSLAVSNSLHMVSVVIQFIVETCSPSALSMVFEVAPNLPAAVQGAASASSAVLILALHSQCMAVPDGRCADCKQGWPCTQRPLLCLCACQLDGSALIAISND